MNLIQLLAQQNSFIQEQENLINQQRNSLVVYNECFRELETRLPGLFSLLSEEDSLKQKYSRHWEGEMTTKEVLVNVFGKYNYDLSEESDSKITNASSIGRMVRSHYSLVNGDCEPPRRGNEFVYSVDYLIYFVHALRDRGLNI